MKEEWVPYDDTFSLKLFTLAIENVFKQLSWSKKGVNLDDKNLTHLRYTDDIVIIAESEEEL